ncbi:hypothetical protein LIER_23512 [Lithospermum erythrorhizon]|uniref:Uncharacterized protein n=1 Tax=Lithospermum erythrorhizon TaxID=34254 RepID=A0AAV3R1G2_LITER
MSPHFSVSVFRSYLKRRMLNYHNFDIWSRFLRKVLAHEQTEYVLLNELPIFPKDADPDDDKLRYDQYLLMQPRYETKNALAVLYESYARMRRFPLRLPILQLWLQGAAGREKGKGDKGTATSTASIVEGKPLGQSFHLD